MRPTHAKVSTRVSECLNKQKSERRPFGSIAIELGYLTRDEVNELLEIQNNEPSLGDILVEMGLIERAIMEKEMAEYKPKKYTQVPSQEENTTQCRYILSIYVY